MKIRVINQNGLFVPQFQKKSYYSANWSVFGSPGVKFLKKEKALEFVKLVEASVGAAPIKKQNEVIYTNFAPEGKI